MTAGDVLRLSCGARQGTWRAPLAVFLVALTVRVAYVHSIRTLGFFKWPLSDARVYVEAARDIAAGDWAAPATFMHAPSYAYLLTILRLIAGEGLLAPRLAQAVLGAAACGLAALLGRQLFGGATGLLAGLMLAVYPPAIFFDGLIQKTSLEILLSAAALWTLVRCAGRSRSLPSDSEIGRDGTLAPPDTQVRRLGTAARANREVGRFGAEEPCGEHRLWFLHGLCLGLLILTRQNALALLPVSLFAAWLSPVRTRSASESDGAQSPTPPAPRPPAQRPAGPAFGHADRRPMPRSLALRVPRAASGAARVAAVAAGVALMLGPWAFRNRVVLGEFILTTPNLGQNFAMGNRPGGSGTYETMTRGRGTGDLEQAAWERDVSQRLGRPASPREISDFYLRRALHQIAEQPVAWLRLMVWKLGGVLGAYEWPDTEDYYLYLEHVPLLFVADRVWHFGVLLPLAAAGACLTHGEWRRLWSLYAWIVVNILAIALFVVFARYRSPLFPALVVLAAAGVNGIAAALRTRSWRQLAMAGVALLVAATVANGSWQRPRRPLPFAYTNHAVALANLKRFPEALREFDAALRLDPNNIDAHWNRGSAWFDLGEYEKAIADYDFTAQRDPGFAIAWRGLGDAHLRLGRFIESERAFRRAVELEPTDPRGRNGLAAALASRGRLDEAVEILKSLVKDRPTFAEAWLNLGNAHLLAGRLDPAAAALDEALRLLPTYADALSSRGVVEAQRGRLDLAVERFRAALAVDPSHRASGRNLIDALLQQRRVSEALEELRRMRVAHPQDPELQELETRLKALGP